MYATPRSRASRGERSSDGEPLDAVSLFHLSQELNVNYFCSGLAIVRFPGENVLVDENSMIVQPLGLIKLCFLPHAGQVVFADMGIAHARPVSGHP